MHVPVVFSTLAAFKLIVLGVGVADTCAFLLKLTLEAYPRASASNVAANSAFSEGKFPSPYLAFKRGY